MRALWLGGAIALTVVAAPLLALAANDDVLPNTPEYAPANKVCHALVSLKLPSVDDLDVATIASLKGCDSEALYYGIGIKADVAKARQCALIEMRDGANDGFSGESLLMTMYANGKGVPRNLDIATAFACDVFGAPAEVNGRVAHLQSLKSGSYKAEGEFTFCDDVTSGLAEGTCAAHDLRINDATRDAKLADLRSHWSGNADRAFPALYSAAKNFVDARSRSEVDLSGTARAAFELNEESALKDQFLADLTSIVEGKFPAATAEQSRQADIDLNETYRTIMVNRDFDAGTVTKEQIRETERVWLKYRDAWVAFVRKAYPTVSTASVKTALTNERKTSLQDFTQ